MGLSVNVWDLVRVPFDTVRRGYREMRKALFTTSRHDGMYLVVDGTPEEIRTTLGARSFAPNWEFSYHERGEVLNLARVVYAREAVDGTTYRWWQTHVRGWVNDRGEVELGAHWELEPTENGNAHIDGVGIDVERGRDILGSTLDAAGVDYERRRIEE
jgi:hypothetical protein